MSRKSRAKIQSSPNFLHISAETKTEAQIYIFEIYIFEIILQLCGAGSENDWDLRGALAMYFSSAVGKLSILAGIEISCWQSWQQFVVYRASFSV